MVKSLDQLRTVDDTEAAFYDAISRADIHAMMALWADDDGIVCIHPSAVRLIGHAAIRASWETIFKHGGIHIRAVQLHATHNLMTSIHNVIEEIQIVAGEQQDIHVIATNVYVKTPHGWRIVAHHASVAPGKAVAGQTGGKTLH